MQYLNRYLFSTVFLTGAAVLILEVAAVRVLAPHYGSSLYVFSSVLTVILAALSVGYWYGGRRADQKHSLDELFACITIAGLLTLLLLLGIVTLLPVVSPYFSPTLGPLILSITLFFIPAFLLGIVSPYIIKIQSLNKPPEAIGSVVGKTFFWGTFGSILGSIMSGFWLIPTLGVERTILAVSIVLVALGIMMPIFLNRPLHKKWLLCICLLAAILGATVLVANSARAENYVYHTEGIYSSITITDTEIYGQHARLLNRDTNNSSAIFLRNTNLVFDYTQFAHLYKHLKPETTSMLMLGGGAYTIPRTLVATDPTIKIDVVEIEPVLYELAQEYFDLTDTTRITNYPEDARTYLLDTDKKYDVIFADLFSTNLAAPFHLTTYEYYLLVREHLTDDGIFIMNYVGKAKAPAPSLTGSVAKTIKTVFPNMRMIGLDPHHKTKRQNIMFIARKNDLPLDLSGTALPSARLGEIVPETMELDLGMYSFRDEYLLTDDHAPVDRLMAKQW